MCMASAVDLQSSASPAPVRPADLAEAWSRQRAVILAFSRRNPAEVEADALIHDAAALIAETMQAPMFCSVRSTDDGSQLVLKLASAGGQSPDALHTVPGNSANDSLAGYALSTRQPIVCEDVAGESRCKDAFLRNHGVASGLVLPLWTEECSFGALGILFAEPRSFAAADVEFAETIAHMLVATLARIRAENGWRAERQMSASLFQNVDSLVIMTDLHGAVLRVNRACEEISGYTSQEVRGRSAWSTFAVPEEAEPAHGRLRDSVIQPGGPTIFELALLTKHGARRRMRWTQTVLMDDYGQAQSVLISGNSLPEEQRTEPGQRGGKTPSAAALGGADRAAGGGSGAQPFQAISQPGFDGVRSSPRRAYPYRQRVAPLQPGVAPDKLAFEEVQFHDISAGGVSYHATRRPGHDTVVLALGAAPNVHYISARIVNVSEVQEDGETAFHVGCRFIERLHC